MKFLVKQNIEFLDHTDNVLTLTKRMNYRKIFNSLKTY
jgi:hypothetical protein